MTYEKPLPQPNEDTRPFWDSCKEHRLRFQKCRICGHVRWPPSIVCPVCYAHDFDWLIASGKGKIYTFTIYHQVQHKAFKNDIPYVTAIVELKEGPHLLTNIVECVPAQVMCDMPVEVVWEDITEEFSLPKFKPAP
ncbi:MAG: Zn-ribbon domain-containing OB-fold protein [Dehalococcoidia bacterium]|nr:Zn-ribbon domain-containing OB-fold protein [Dehalococcoidia bacterium]